MLFVRKIRWQVLWANNGPTVSYFFKIVAMSVSQLLDCIRPAQTISNGFSKNIGSTVLMLVEVNNSLMLCVCVWQYLLIPCCTADV